MAQGRRAWTGFPGALVLAALVAASPAPAAAQEEAGIVAIDPETVALLFERPLEQRFRPGQVLVKMKAGVVAATAADAAAELGLGTEPRALSGGMLLYSFAPATAAALSAADLQQQTLEAAAALAADPNVEYAHPNYILEPVVVPNDPLYPLQWHYQEPSQVAGGIGLPSAWDGGTGDPAVVVAVIDTGILPNHPDVVPGSNLVAGFDFITDTFTANDGDGRDADPTDPGNAVGPGQCGPGSPARPSSWHGTHVAGTVGAVRTDNGVGVAGVNWQAKIQAVRVLGRCGGDLADISDAIRWSAGLPVPGAPANATPAKVLNLSLGGPSPCSAAPALQSAIDDAVAAGATVVVAAGNDAQNASGFLPASCNGVITVAASDYRGRLVSRYSNFGATIEILAPGGDVERDDDNDGNPDGVLSAVQGGYAFYNGTSMAAPHVAGVAALLLADDPGRTPADVLACLQATARPRSSNDCPQACGAGLLDAGFAPGVKVRLPGSLRVRRGQSSNLVATVTDGCSPLPGVTVSFQSADPGIASVAAAAVTDASGRAQVAVQGVARGNTTITAQAQAVSAQAPVEVTVRTPAGSAWGLLAVALLGLWLLGRRLRRQEAT